MSNLVEHAKRELDLLGEDEVTTAGMLRVIQAFADMGHSGFSAEACTQYLEKLLRYQNLTPITDDPREWQYHGPQMTGNEDGIYQSRRNPSIFSKDGGVTYYYVEIPTVTVTSLHKE